jgi:hypothetical protein
MTAPVVRTECGTEGSGTDPRINQTQLTCVLTRMELRHAWQAVPLWLHYRRVRRSLGRTRNLLSMSLACESPRVWFTISLWRKPLGTAEAATREHIEAVRFAHRLCRGTWSAQLHLTRLSRSSRTWKGLGVDWGRLVEESGVDHSYLPSFTYCDGEVVSLRPKQAPVPRGGREHEQEHHHHG